MRSLVGVKRGCTHDSVGEGHGAGRKRLIATADMLAKHPTGGKRSWSVRDALER
jgi:hypothetical protein